MKLKPLLIACAMLATCFLAGCTGKYDGTLHAHAQAGWRAWEQDRRPVLPDEQYNQLFVDKRGEFMAAGSTEAEATKQASFWMADRYVPQGLVNARIAERDQGERHAESLK